MKYLEKPNGEPAAAAGALEQAAPPRRLRYGYGDVYDAEPVETTDSGLLLEYWGLLKRNAGKLGLAAVAGGVLGFLISLPQTPVYRARALLEIEPLNENFLNLRDVNPTSPANGSIEYDISTQVEVLESRVLLEKVVASLELGERLDEIRAGGRLTKWKQALGLASSDVPPEEQALEIAEENFSVAPSNKTRVVEITSEWPAPELAASFANELAETFIEHNLESHWQSTQRTGHWLQRQLSELRARLETSEKRLQTYARNTGLLFTADKESVAEERLRQLQSELLKAEAGRIAKQSRYELAKGAPQGLLPDILDDSPLTEYQKRLADLRRRKAELGATLTPEHYKVKQVQAQIDELEETIASERKQVVERIRNEYEAARRREELLAADYANQARLVSEQANKAIQYNIYKREVDTNRQLYDNLLQKVKEAGVASAIRASNIRVIDPAKPPRRPHRPNHALNAALGMLAGLLGRVAFVFVGERADRTIRQPGDSHHHLHLPELGVIPASTSVRLPRSGGGAGGELRRAEHSPLTAGLNGHGRGEEVELISWRRKPTLVSECFRAAVTSILFTGSNGSRPRVLVVSSAVRGEGKTTVASNLAICLAEINQRVLLADADMRRPRLHRVFEVSNRRGLSSLLASREPLPRLEESGCVQPSEVPNLFVLPAGPPSHSISNLLHSTRVEELLARARNEFDAVVIDTPPMLQISDARVLGAMADGVVLVVRAGKTTRETARAAASRFLEDGTRVLGAILNSWDPKSNGAGYYGYSREYTDYYAEQEPREAQPEEAS